MVPQKASPSSLLALDPSSLPPSLPPLRHLPSGGPAACPRAPPGCSCVRPRAQDQMGHEAHAVGWAVGGWRPAGHLSWIDQIQIHTGTEIVVRCGWYSDMSIRRIHGVGVGGVRPLVHVCVCVCVCARVVVCLSVYRWWWFALWSLVSGWSSVPTSHTHSTLSRLPLSPSLSHPRTRPDMLGQFAR